MYIYILLIILFAGLGYLVYIFFSHYKDIKNLDVDSISEAKQEEVKAKILQAKLSRQTSKWQENIKTALTPMREFLNKKSSQLKGKLNELEGKYKEDNQNEKNMSVDELLTQAGKKMEAGDFESAEDGLIEVISKDKKNSQAYEMLFDLYMKNKKYDEAEEVAKYLIKLTTVMSGRLKNININSIKKEALEESELKYLSSMEAGGKVASYYGDLANVYEITEKPEKALDAYLKAASVEPNNPKYLDGLIRMSIDLNDKGLAKQILHHLEGINPENAKLDDLKAAIEKL